MSSDKNYQGTDVNLETSLEEYGFVARPITVDYDDEYFVIYKMDDNQYGSGHIRESELDAIVNGTEWASEEDVNSMLETVGATKEEWFDLPFTSKFSDLVSYWGTENIMGTDYYPNDKKWAFEEIGLESDDEYADGGRVKVGVFDENQLRNKEDKKAVEKAQKETGLNYVDTKIKKKGGKMFLEVYLISDEEYYNSSKFAKGGGVKIKSAFRLYNSPLIKFANFKDGSHINLMRLIKPYKNGEKYGISKMSINKIGDEVRIFKTLEDAESYFDRIVNQKKKNVDLREEVGTTNNYGKGGVLGADARLEYVTDAFASGSLMEELKEKLGIKTDSLGDNYVISFAYTDYGGDFIDKVAIAYFKENYPDNTLFENAGYNGENAYVFGEPAKEWIETTQDYPLGFEDIEDFYYEKISEQENEDFNYFLDEIKGDYSFDKDEALQWLNENRGGYFGMTTQGLDFSFEDLTNDLVNEGVIVPNEEDEDEDEDFAKGGGVERLVGSFYYDTRKDKTFRVISVDGTDRNGNKRKDGVINIGIQYYDKNKQPIGSIESIDKDTFDYYVSMGAWGEYKQSYFKDGGMFEAPIGMMKPISGKVVGSVPISEDLLSSEVKDFIDYVYEAYKEDGFTKEQVKKAVNKYLKELGKEYTYGGGDSLDRERVYQFLLNPNLKEIKNPTFAKGGGVKLPKDAKIRINWVDVSVYKDSWEEGETDNVNNYDMVGIKGSVVSPKELIGFLAENIYTSEDISDYVLIDNNIHTSVRQDADGMEASKSEIEEWKKGNLELFSANYVINVSVISEIDADAETLSSLTGIGVYKKSGKVGKYAKGGGVENMSYENIYEVLKDKIDNSIDDLDRTYENSSDFKGEEVEHKFRDGFIPYTNGGYEASWFEYVSMLNSTGYSLPTEKLKAEMQRHVDYAYELAKDTFKETYPEIVDVVGEDNIDYHSLYEAGFSDEAEELSEWEMENMSDEDSIYCSITAYYYEPTNDRGQDGKHTISLQGVINLEAPYHRAGRNEDFTEIIFTFDSMEELNSKMDDGLKQVIAWFNGDKPTGSDDTFAKGGSTKLKFFNVYNSKTKKTLKINAPTLADAKILAEEIDYNDYEDGEKIDFFDWFWNHDYRHYLRDASPKQRSIVKQKFIDKGLKLNGSSPQHAYIVISTIKPSELKKYKKVGSDGIEFNGDFAGGYKFSNGGGVDEIKNYNNEDELIEDALNYINKELSVNLNRDDFEKYMNFEDKVDFYKTKNNNPKTFKKVQDVIQKAGKKLGANFDGKDSLELEVQKKYFNVSSKMSVFMNVAHFTGIGNNRSTQNFFVFPKYFNKYKEVVGGLRFADGGSVFSDMTEKEFLKEYFGVNTFTSNPSEYFDIKKLSSSNDSKVENFISELKRDGYSVKKKSYSDFTSVMGVKKKDAFANGGILSSKELDLNHQYTYTIDKDNNGSIYKEAGVYFVKGFENGKHFSETFEKLKDAKDFFIKKAVKKHSTGGGVDDADWIEESLIDLQNETGFDDLVVENSYNNQYTASNGDAEFEVFETEDDARERAIERVKEDLEENPEYFNRTWIMNYIDGKDFFERVFNEWNESYVNDIESEDSDKYANRLIEEMVENGIISSEEAKEDDFDAEDYKDSFVELLTNNQIEEGYDGLQNYIDNFGEEQAFKVVVDNNLIDIDRASESAVDTDGIAHFLSSYDGEQIDLSNGHVAYRTN